MSARRGAPVDAEAEVPDAAVADSGLTAATALGATEKASTRRSRRHSIERPGRGSAAVVEEEAPQRPARKPRTATGSTRASRSRHARPPETELIEPVPSRPRRPRPVEPPAEPVGAPAPPSRARDPRDARDPGEHARHASDGTCRPSSPAARTNALSATSDRSAPTGTNAASDPNGGRVSPTTSPARRTVSREATAPGRTTRCHGCAIEARMTASRVPRTGTGRGGRATRTPIPGSTTSDHDV